VIIDLHSVAAWKQRDGNFWNEEVTMPTELSPAALAAENHRFSGSGGRSQENRQAGFSPAFRDAETGMVYPSRFADGRPAPFHLLDGLPDELVLLRHPSGRVEAVKSSLVSGFLRNRRFFTRDEAASWAGGRATH
jgi:hypothetical protein